MREIICFLFIFIFSFVESKGCQDKTWQCILWKKYCTDPLNQKYMHNECKETCGLCEKKVCADSSWRCTVMLPYCKDKNNKKFMMKHCRKTCNFCSDSKVPAAPPVPPVPTVKLPPTGQCGIPKIQSGRVINGVNAKRGVWPWQVAIRYYESVICGGTLISPFWVVTAAHCVHGNEVLVDYFKVIAGKNDFNVSEDSQVQLPVSKVITHKLYNPRTLDYDIALIKLAQPVPFNQYTGMACLPEKDDVVPVGTTCFITGWGKIQVESNLHPKLQQAKLPVVTNKQCSELNTNTTGIEITSRMLCAGHGPSDSRSGCHGDSGGPFVCKTGKHGNWVLHGAVSWGSSTCDSKKSFSVFARITYLREWIDEQMSAY